MSALGLISRTGSPCTARTPRSDRDQAADDPHERITNHDPCNCASVNEGGGVFQAKDPWNLLCWRRLLVDDEMMMMID